MSDDITLILRRVSQPIGNFYVSKIAACDLKDMANANVRKMLSVEEKYTGIQRQQSSSRVNEIRKYIGAPDASFPNSVILNVDERFIKAFLPIEFPGGDEEFYAIIIKKDESSFSIIDGQHRLAGFDKENCGNFDIIVTIFLDLDIELQATLFSTINMTQVNVNKSLVYDLFDVSRNPSPQKTAHNVVKLLNSEEESPLFRRIKLLGVNPKFEGEILYKGVLAQGTVIQRIINLISKEPEEDRRKERLGKPIELDDNYLEKGIIFRKFYIERKDWAIYKVLLNYFRAVARYFPNEWNDLGNPLAKTIGFGGLVKLLVPMYREGLQRATVAESFFDEKFAEMRRKYDRLVEENPKVILSFENYPAVGSSERVLGRFFQALAGYDNLEEFLQTKQ